MNDPLPVQFCGNRGIRHARYRANHRPPPLHHLPLGTSGTFSEKRAAGRRGWLRSDVERWLKGEGPSEGP